MSIPIVDPSRYDAQLEEKHQRLIKQFSRFDVSTVEVFPSVPEHYRMRAEFRIWHSGDDLFYAMFKVDPDNPKQREVIRLDHYAVASQRINELMPQLREALLKSDVLRHRIFQVEFLTTLQGEALVTLIYHRPLDDVWEAEARALEAALGVYIIGRSRKQRIVLTQDFVTEHLNVEGKIFHYQQVENSFTQPNAVIAASMLSWARSVTAPDPDEANANKPGRDLVELYCGNGHFSIALAENFNRVLATEISRTSVASAQHNLIENGVTNTIIARMSAEEFSRALSGEHRGRRASAWELDNYDFGTVLVDPPRAGLDENSCEELTRYERIVYISCNPDTLCRDLERMMPTHRVLRFALFDQFPYTHHCECGVLLEKR